ADLLRDRGAVPVVMPLIDIEPIPPQAAALAALHPADFDWLVVSSPNGAEAYRAVHRAAAAQRVAAVGRVTARTLQEGGVEVALVPATQSAEGLLAEMPPGPARTLLVQAVDAEPTLAHGLAAAGHTVTGVTPYRSVPARPTAGQQLAALSADAVLFASGSAARAWAAVFGDSTPPVVVAIGPQTAAAAQAAGLKVTLVAADHSLPGLVSALERSLSTVE
ncbi:MAG TPA: uroporphyrinogen-III synthase, partial [Acidimicrobiaceae bacterium]|nr:uroporphyrinogen-III synthase [Acidimicrobiaceae bacterium]